MNLLKEYLLSEFFIAPVIAAKYGVKELQQKRREKKRSALNRLQIFRKDMKHRKQWGKLKTIYREDPQKFNQIRKRYFKMRGWLLT